MDVKYDGKGVVADANKQGWLYKFFQKISPSKIGIGTVMKMNHRLLASILILLLSAPAFAGSRIKDIAHFSGVRGNSLVGYGLVIGLNKTGDKKQTIFTQQTLVNILEQFRPDPQCGNQGR